MEAAEANSSEGRATRTITVCVAAEASLGRNEFWTFDITRVVGRVSRIFRKEFGITFKIKAYDYWDPEAVSPAGGPAGPMNPESLRSILPTLSKHRRQVESPGRGQDDRPSIGDNPVACDILMGLVPEGPDGPMNPGIADYPSGIVVLKYLKNKGGMVYVLLHELCHLFGAIDLQEKGTVMSRQDPAFKIHGFTMAIVLANRERFFRPGECPLDEEKLGQALALYEGRLALGLERDELSICLYHLQALLKE